MPDQSHPNETNAERYLRLKPQLMPDHIKSVIIRRFSKGWDDAKVIEFDRMTPSQIRARSGRQAAKNKSNRCNITPRKKRGPRSASGSSFDEARIDVIGQNGPSGLHYDE